MKLLYILGAASVAYMLFNKDKGGFDGPAQIAQAYPDDIAPNPSVLRSFNPAILAQAQALASQYNVPVMWLLNSGVGVQQLELFADELSKRSAATAMRYGDEWLKLDTHRIKAGLIASARGHVLGRPEVTQATSSSSSVIAPTGEQLAGCSCRG